MSIKTGTHLFNLFSFKSLILAMALIASFGLVQAQRLMDDFTPVIKGYPIIYSSALDQEGNLYVAGLFGIVGSETTSTIVRIHPNGSLDPTFNAPADLYYFTTDIIVSSDSVLLCLNDRKLLVLKKDGAIEESFQPDNSFFDVSAAAIAGDKYIVGARAKSNGDSKIFRFNRDGTIDDSFEEITLGELPSKTKIKVLSDGKILIAGKINTFNTIEVGGVIRLNQDGTLDETFDSGMAPNSSVEELEIQPDGKIILAGTFTTFNNVDTHGIIRLTEDGTIDPDFGLSATENAFVFYALQVEIKENGKILVGGYSRDGSYQGFYKIIQLNSDGSLDELFNPTIIKRAANGLSFSMHGGSDGVVYASGDINGASGEIRIGVIAFDEAGAVLEFNPKIGNVPSISDVVRQNDGKIIITGEFYQINNTQVYGIARINTDGSLDQAFQANIDFSDPRANQAYEVELQSDGKIILAGLLHNIDNSNSNQHQIIRLLSDGTIDDSFSAIRTEFKISDLSVSQFDEIFVTGRFSSVNYENARNGLAKFSPGGSFISEFNSSNFLPSGSTTSSIKLLSNNEILIGGFLEDLSKGYVYRIDANGNLMSSLAEGGLDYNLIHFVDAVDELIFFGGNLSSGGDANTKTPLFITDQSGSNLNGTAVQISDKYLGSAFFGILKISDNDILVGGSFTEINDIEKSGLAKVTLSGIVDEEFTFNSYGLKDWGGRINHILREDDETALVFGSLSKINEKPFFGAARIKFLNDVPVINGSNSVLFTYEDSPIEISLLNLTVTDEDNAFPEGFTMTIQEGENYTFSENTITPIKDFFGTLAVPLIVSDGKDESEPYQLSIEVTPVNDKPVISGFVNIPGVTEGETFSLSLDNFTVTDPDNTFPDDFSLMLEAGTNYTLDGLTVIPNTDFNGKLIVRARVNDGEVSSDVFEAEVTVVSTNEAPAINGFGGTLSTSEETALTIDLSDFSVTDPDNTFPDDFTLIIESGDNYSVAGSTITPATDFNGTLTVPIKVNDGEADSPTLELFVEVTPVNDAPVILSYAGILTGGEDAPLAFILDGFTVTDPDNTFPTDFSFTLEAGDNYTVDGASILPAANYFGSLSVLATVSDGAATSAPYVIAVTINPVNDNAVITGYSGTTTTPEETALTIDMASLAVTDPDNSFPADFTLDIFESTTYTISGAQIIPINDFNGTMTVPVRVSTIDNNSEHFNLTIEVTPVNDVPVIEGYSGELEMDENTSLEFNINSFLVSDPDNTFPDEHSVLVSEGDNYSVNDGSSITPTTDFTGELSVPVSVSDGTATSAPSILNITVNEVTGISSIASSVAIFPTPTENELTLKIDNGFVGDFNIRLVDLTGKVVLDRTIRKNARSFESVIDLQHLGDGTFVFHVELTGHEVISRRIIIE